MNNRVFKFRVWDKTKKEFYYPLAGLHASYVVNENYVIQQFTGVTDINGKEIYEGDVVRFARFKKTDDFYHYLVEFRHGRFELTDSLEHGYHPHCMGLDIGYCREVVIVGNICENLEYMKEKP